MVYRITELDNPLHSVYVALGVTAVDRKDYELLASVDQSFLAALFNAVEGNLHYDDQNDSKKSGGNNFWGGGTDQLCRGSFLDWESLMFAVTEAVGVGLITPSRLMDETNSTRDTAQHYVLGCSALSLPRESKCDDASEVDECGDTPLVCNYCTHINPTRRVSLLRCDGCLRVYTRERQHPLSFDVSSSCRLTTAMEQSLFPFVAPCDE